MLITNNFSPIVQFKKIVILCNQFLHFSDKLFFKCQVSTNITTERLLGSDRLKILTS